MRIIDLSQTMENGMPQYPGHPATQIERRNTVEHDGFQMTDFHAVVHSGTHCDAPAHFIAGGQTMADIPVDRFVGEAVVVDVSGKPGKELGTDVIQAYDIRCGDIVLFSSRTDELWGQPGYLTDYPYIGEALASDLVRRHVKAIGLDFMSPDPVNTETSPAHQILLGHQLGIVENLRGLAEIARQRVFFAAAPIKIAESDGAFARAFAIIDW